jgi:ribosomal protein S18 acetylase RimI-like enzyme
VNRTAIALLIRPLSPLDRSAVETMTRASGVFRSDEVKVALEVFDAALGVGRPPDPDYETAGAEVDGEVLGWICWGPTPCTLGTFDLYWIVVRPDTQGQGVGGALVEEMERRIAGRARIVVVETAGRAEYAATRAFYDARGYRVAARIADYYAPGDDLVTYAKRFEWSTAGA